MFTQLQQRVPTMTSGHGGCLVPKKNDIGRQADKDGPISCSSLTLEREGHLIITQNFRLR
jgi:hypothetical protein